MSANKYLPSRLKFDVETNPLRTPLGDGNDEIINDSFYFDDINQPLRSTQQLKVNWSEFQNHTFFMSAEVKVNLAFEQIINKYPFDGTKAEVQKFIDELTGFEKWVFDTFPRNLGSLDFNESYIVVKDSAGSLFSDLSKDISGDSRINPPNERTPLTIEFMLTVPSDLVITGQRSVICQKMSRADMGFSVNLIDEGDSPKVEFVVVSGSNYVATSADIRKNVRNHVCLSLERNNLSTTRTESKIKIFVNEELVTTSKTSKIGFLDIMNVDFLIGSGSRLTWGNEEFDPEITLFGNLDEFRIFHTTRSVKQQKIYAEKNIFSTLDDSGSPEMKLYFKFNEPSGLGSEGGIVLDSSGNSLHSYIQGYGDFLRKPGALNNESIFFNPVLFPGDEDVVSLNKMLLTEAKQYDVENPNLITKLLPPHYLLEGAKKEGFGNQVKGYSGNQYEGNGPPGSGVLGSQQVLLSFLYIWAKFFDEIKLYIDQFGNLKYTDYDDLENVPDNFLESILKEYGINLPNFFADSNVEQYINGENITREIGRNENPLKWLQSQLNKRVIISLPKILSSKGTQHSIKSFLRAVGIDPNNSVVIREFGGPSKNNITNSREKRNYVSSMLKVYDNSYVESSFLSGSRFEAGWPEVTGPFFNGQSTSTSDGLFTSGSWFIEGNFKFKSDEPKGDRSLLRLMTLGFDEKYITHNLVAIPPTKFVTGSKIELNFYDGTQLKNMYLNLPNGGIFDGDVWYVSFGKIRNDDPYYDNEKSEYHLRAGKQNDGEILSFYTTSSIYNQNSIFEVVSPDYNASGSYISFGRFESTDDIVNNPTYNMPLSSTLDGQISSLKFWSKSISENETLEHIKNFKSFGSEDPLTFFNYSKTTQSGTFNRLRVDSIQRQGVLTSDYLGNLEIFDFTRNFPNLMGKFFDASKSNFAPEIVNYTQLSTRFDEDSTNEKVRYRSVNKLSKYESEKPWIVSGDLHKLTVDDMSPNNNKFSVEFSLVEALNRDIANMFSTFENFNNYLGSTNLLFSEDYPDISNLRDAYFSRLEDKIDFAKFFEFYRWFDSSIGLFIDQLIPKRTQFAGTQHVIEPHILERSKFQYHYHENYTFNQFEKRNVKLPNYESPIRKY